MNCGYHAKFNYSYDRIPLLLTEKGKILKIPISMGNSNGNSYIKWKIKSSNASNGLKITGIFLNEYSHFLTLLVLSSCCLLKYEYEKYSLRNVALSNH